MAEKAQIAVIGGTYARAGAADSRIEPIYRPAGAAAETALLLGAMGCRVFFISAIGRDAAGNSVVKELRKVKVSVDFSRRTEERTQPPPASDSENPGAGARIGNDLLLGARAMLSSCHLVYVLPDIPPDAFSFAVDIAHYYKIPVMVRAAPPLGIPRKKFHDIDVLVTDTAGAAALAKRDIRDLDDATASLRLLLGLGVGSVVITIGALGAAGAMSVEEPFFVPAPFTKSGEASFNPEVFTAYLCRTLAAGANFKNAVFKACSAAALAGGRDNPDPAKIDAALKKHILLPVVAQK